MEHKFITQHRVVDDSERSADVQTNQSFEDLGVLSEMIDKFAKMRILAPSPIQVLAMPMIFMGVDLLVQAKSGTGKTLVFTSSVVQSVDEDRLEPQALIVAPTREICEQIHSTIERICYKKLNIGLCLGGEGTIGGQTKALTKGCQIVVGTLGRIKQLIEENTLKLDKITSFIIDEADKMMEGNFQADLSFVFKNCSPNKQTCVFSATYTDEILEILGRFMIDATFIRLNSENVQLLGIKQYVALKLDNNFVDPKNKFVFGVKIAADILKTQQFNQAIVFVNEARKLVTIAEKLHSFVKDYPMKIMSSKLTQKERSKVMKELKEKKIKVLISTDLLSRGVDSEHIDLVINLECPNDVETYLHRIGRAGRFGNFGATFTVLDKPMEIMKFTDMVDTNSLEVKFLTKKMGNNPNLATDKSVYDGGACYDGDMAKTLCSPAYDMFLSGRFVFNEEEVVEAQYERKEMMAIRNTLTLEGWQRYEGSSLNYNREIMSLLDRKKFGLEVIGDPGEAIAKVPVEKKVFVPTYKPTESQKSYTSYYDVEAKLPGSNLIMPLEPSKYTGNAGGVLTPAAEKVIESDGESPVKSSPNKNQKIGVDSSKELGYSDVVHPLEENLQKYDRKTMGKIGCSKAFAEWTTQLSLNIRDPSVLEQEPFQMDQALRNPFAIRSIVEKENEKAAYTKIYQQNEKVKKLKLCMQAGKITTNWAKDCALTELPDEPADLHQELCDLAFGNGKYKLEGPSITLLHLSQSAFKTNPEDIHSLMIADKKFILSAWLSEDLHSL